MRIIFLILLSASAVQAGPWHHVTHYIRTHKELLVSDTLAAGALSADAASSVRAQQICPMCIEQNSLLGSHPSPAATWGVAISETGAEIILSHLVWKFAPQPIDRHIIWIWSAPLAAEEISNVKGNTEIHP